MQIEQQQECCPGCEYTALLAVAGMMNAVDAISMPRVRSIIERFDGGSELARATVVACLARDLVLGGYPPDHIIYIISTICSIAEEMGSEAGQLPR